MIGTFPRFAVAVVAALASATPATADAIDGNWCHADGRHLSIRGPQIVTPGGRQIEGNYSRHYFSYSVPESEPAAGQTVFMTLLNEYTVHLRTGTASTDAAPEVWKRCTPTISKGRSPSAPAG